MRCFFVFWILSSSFTKVRACKVRHPAIGRAGWFLWHPRCRQVLSFIPDFSSSLLSPLRQWLTSVSSSSIPNPLFDLAGITCGHFLVPFWTFFGATLIGKAVIKMHIQVRMKMVLTLDRTLTDWSFHFQKIFVILAFNKELFEGAVSLLVQIPVLGKNTSKDTRVWW